MSDKIDERLRQRFWRRVDRGTSCWTWTGKRDPYGYGVLYVDRRTDLKAHRFAYELAKGRIPADMKVCHECDNPGCVNPDHLFLGTQRDNIQDMVRKGRRRNGTEVQNACKAGHPFDAANTRITPKGHRVCRACHRDNQRRHRERAEA